MANLDSEFFGLVFPGFQATQNIHAQNSHPELSAFLSNFTLLNPKLIHGDFLLTGETKKCPQPRLPLGQERKISPKRKFWPGHPCGHPAKNFGQALQILEKKKHFGTDIPRGRP